MSLFNVFKNQLSQVIQWENQAPEVLWHKFPSGRDEIKNASKLIVGPGQGCVLVYEGKVVDNIEKEGIFNLKTDNHPFVTTLVNIRKNFESEHKLLVYYYRRAEVLNQGWGTASPVKYVDGVYNIPVEMGANGNFSYHISDVSFLFNHIVGSKEQYGTRDMQQVIINRIPQFIAAYLARHKHSFQEIDANLETISDDVRQQLNEEFGKLGLTLTDFRIIGTQFDEATRERIARVADITADITAAKQAGLAYTDLEQLRALRDAARNEGGLAGAGLQMGVGMELGKQFNEKTDEVLNQGNPDVVEKLRKLQLLLSENIITAEEFEAKKAALLDNL